MKKNLFPLSFAVSLLLFVSISLQAENPKETKHPLAGVWQQIQLSTGTNKSVSALHAPFFKVLNNDGTFFNLVYPTRNQPAYFSQIGTYEILNDSTYMENIESAPLERFRGRKSPMKYQLIDNNKLLLAKWYNEKIQQWIPELWMRVEVPNGDLLKKENEL